MHTQHWLLSLLLLLPPPHGLTARGPGPSLSLTAAAITPIRYKKVKAQCEKEGACEMGGFTRLLHSGTPDDLMDELPTVVVDPLPTSMVEHSWYIVLNRPYAFVQWVSRVNIPERFVLMSEPDHVFLRPLPNFMDGNTPGEEGAWGGAGGVGSGGGGGEGDGASRPRGSCGDREVAAQG